MVALHADDEVGLVQHDVILQLLIRHVILQHFHLTFEEHGCGVTLCVLVAQLLETTRHWVLDHLLDILLQF